MSNRQVDPFHEASVQRRQILGLAQRLFELGPAPHDIPTLDLHDSITSSRLEHLPVKTRRAEDLAADTIVVLEAIGDDEGQRGTTRPVAKISEDLTRVSVASTTDESGWPWPGRDVDDCEYPEGGIP